MKKTTRFITTAAVIAALYTVLSYATNFIPSVGGLFDLRIAEAMCILPMFTPAAIPGLIVGCFLSNLLNHAVIYDMIFGTLATAIGAVLTHILCYRKGDITGGNYTLRSVIAAIPPILANAFIIPFVIVKLEELPITIKNLFPFFVSVGLGELVCCGVLGVMLALALKPHAKRIFGEE